MKYLVTGGFGFLGSNISAELLKRGHEVAVFDNLYRYGSHKNREWLESIGDFAYFHGDIRSPNDVEKVIKIYKPDVIYHLAGQVAMTTSLEDPRLDFEVNVLGTFNLLNSVKNFCPESVVVYSSTNKVYGDLSQYCYVEGEKRYICPEKPEGFDEKTEFNPKTPYGVSKAAAELYVRDFFHSYGIKTLIFRHSSIYGGRQFATYDQGWVGWFVEEALEIKNGRLKSITISGNGKQVRDLLYSSDCVDLYIRAVEKIDSIAGNVFNIGGGMVNSMSILELFEFLEMELDIKINYECLPPRLHDQKVFVADISKARELIGWEPRTDKHEGIRNLIKWVYDVRSYR